MGEILGALFAREGERAEERRNCAPLMIAFVCLALLSFGCKRMQPLDTAPLDHAGVSYDAIQELKALNITAPEIAEITQVRQAGLPESDCVEVLRIYRGRGQAFNAGAAIAGLFQVGLHEDTLLELVRLNQVDQGWGELQAMRLAGLSDAIVLEVARHHAQGRAVLSGASLARMKNAGLRDTTLLELARRGVPDSQADAILSARRHRASDADILRHFTGS
jgi:hypothetical protein